MRLISSRVIYLFTIAALFIIVILLAPVVLPNWLLGVGVMCGLYIIAAAGLDVLFGHAGQVSFGQGAFWAIGAYSAAILTTKVGVPTLVAMVAAVLISGLAAAFIGIPMTRLAGHNVAIATLAVALIVVDVISNLVDLTGGTAGITNVPSLRLFGSDVGDDGMFRIAWAVALVAIVVTANVSHSRTGRAFRLVGISDSSAQALGIPSDRYRWMAFVYAGLAAGVSGAIYAVYMSTVSPDAVGVELSVVILVVLMVGGSRSLLGVVVGSVAVTALRAWLGTVASSPAVPDAVAPAINVFAYGLLVVLIMRFSPWGLLPGISSVVRNLRRRRSTRGSGSGRGAEASALTRVS